ncbi:MAG: ATP-dependent zinc protease [Campylobacterales bacterium]|nr:ATP-dependent zinc protease [Campylobacterales bacterium]
MITVGRLEYASLPELGFFDIDAKIDTGADSCSIHCSSIRIDEKNQTVHFKLLDELHPDYTLHDIAMPISKMKRVKSSNGKVEERVFIQTPVSLGGQTYLAQVSLSDRKEMKYPMLIGRKFLAKRYLVDVSVKYQFPKKV